MHWASEVKTKKKGKKIRAGLERRGEASFREAAKLGFQVGGSNQGRNLLVWLLQKFRKILYNAWFTKYVLIKRLYIIYSA